MPFSDKKKKSAYYKKWRTEHGKEKFKRGKARYESSIKRMMLEIKSTSRCIKCDISHPAVISFHHRNPEDKLFNVGDYAILHMGKKSIVEEIAKCDVLCHNCHAILHWEQRDVG